MKYVTLTQRNSQKISVNFDNVLNFSPSAGGGTHILYVDGSAEGVNETYQTVADAVVRAEK